MNGNNKEDKGIFDSFRAEVKGLADGKLGVFIRDKMLCVCDDAENAVFIRKNIEVAQKSVKCLLKIKIATNCEDKEESK